MARGVRLPVYPVAITNTNSVGTVRDAIIEWGADAAAGALNCCCPSVAETWDGDLNDINGFHVKKEHVFAALRRRKAGRWQRATLAAAPGMQCLGFKGGIGTASRQMPPRAEAGGFTVGVLVQCNYGLGDSCGLPGVPVGQEIEDPSPATTPDPLDSALARDRSAAMRGPPERKAREHGSIIVVIATDAPLLPHQLRRVARRAALGIGRMGGIAGSGSGDMFLAFSTTPTGTADTTA